MVKAAAKKVHYMVCVSNDNYSRVACRFACHMAKKNNGSVIMLHVIEPSDFQSFGKVAEKIYQEKRDEAETLLQSLAEMAVQETNITPVLLVKEGMIEHEIIDAVEKDDTLSMLILGAATETMTKSKILPPLVAQLGSKLHVPLLIVPGNLTQAEIEALT
jgi:nucleotide-binding universal stress UspA family protein